MKDEITSEDVDKMEKSFIHRIYDSPEEIEESIDELSIGQINFFQLKDIRAKLEKIITKL